MTNAAKKAKPKVEWRYPHKTGSKAKTGKSAEGKKKPRTKTKPELKRKPKKLKTEVRANPGYEIDVRCDEVFADPVHAFRFRVAMLSTRVRDLITVFDQLELAAKVEAEIDALESRLGRSVPSDVVAQLVDALVMDMERVIQTAA